MNFLANLGPVTSTVSYDDTQFGGPLKRLVTKRAEVINDMNLTRYASPPNDTRYNRLAAFLAQWDVKCGLILMQEREGDGQYSAVQFSLDLASEAATALAVAD